MKNFKKLMALVIAAVMVLGTMSTMIGAATPDDKISITGLTDGDKVTFYQVLEWNGTEAAEYAGWNLKAPFAGAGTALGYTDDPDLTVAGAKTANAKLIAAMVGDPQGNPAVDMQLTSTIAGKLADLATSGGKGPVTVADGKAELSIDGTTNTIGMYMAIIDPKDDDVVYNPVFVSADYTEGGTNTWAVDSAATYSNEAAAKKSTVEIDKTAQIGDKSFDQTWTSTRIGEVVSYTVKTTIPGYGDVYTAPHFVITDKLTDLELVDDLAITLVKPAGLATTNYTITKDADKKGYSVAFTADYLKTVKVPTEVEITYSAKVTSDAHLNVNLEKNEVWVEFSHDPQHEDDYKVKKDDTRHYTYTIDADILGGGSSEINKSTSEIVKVGVDAAGNPVKETTLKSQISTSNEWKSPLADAEFKLYTDEACKNEYKKADGTSFALKSTADGRIKIEGLDATNATSVYWLKETKAPTGFIAQTDPVKIEIIPTFETKEFTEYWDPVAKEWKDSDPTGNLKSDSYEVEILKSYTVKINGKETAKHTFINTSPKTISWDEPTATELPSSIVNTQGVELPSTGGMGTTLFYAIGAILVLGAGILLVSKRRMSAN